MKDTKLENIKYYPANEYYVSRLYAKTIFGKYDGERISVYQKVIDIYNTDVYSGAFVKPNIKFIVNIIQMILWFF